MSKQRERLPVDLADTEDLKAKVVLAEEILETKKVAAAEAEQEAQDWTAKVRGLKILAGMVVTFDGSSTSPMQDLVVDIVEREDRPMRPVGVAEILRGEGHQVASNDAVNAALLAAANAGRLRRPKDRHYAPLQKGKGSP